LSKTSWKKEEMKERDPKGTPKTLMPPTGVHKLDGSENFDGGKNPKCNLERDQIAHLYRLNHKAYQI
jgi:hypothetical protein